MWNQGWDDLFKRKAWGRYPPEDVVRFIARRFFAAPERKTVHILEIGCGPGANIWFMAREGFTVHGIDGSAVAIEQATQRLLSENLAADLRVGDAMNLPWPEASFDAVIDVECIYANSLPDSQRIIAESLRVLKPGGDFFSKTFATGTTGEGSGTQIPGEPNTWQNLTAGAFNSGYGIVRFTDESEIPNLYGGLENLTWEQSSRTEERGQVVVKEWLISGSKPKEVTQS